MFDRPLYHAIVLADAGGVIIYWSPGAKRLFGHAAAEVVGQSLDLMVPERHRARHWAGFRAAMASGVSRLEGAVHPGLPVLCADGAERRFPARFGLLVGPDGSALGAIALYAAAGE